MGAKDRRARVDSRKIELRVNQHALSVRVPHGDNLRPAVLWKLPGYFRLADHSHGVWPAETALFCTARFTSNCRPSDD
jgi:hypothetical protein